MIARHELPSEEVLNPNFDTIRNKSQSKVLREIIAVYWDAPMKFIEQSVGKTRSFSVKEFTRK
jgi:hypothetical protein